MVTPAQRLATSNKAIARRRRTTAETTGTPDCGRASVARYKNAGCRCDKCRSLASEDRKLRSR